jgi:1,4-alpha-glucan branching enzyme
MPEKVYLIGTFNGWSETSIPLFNEKNGYWSTDVSEAKVGDEYRYLIHGPESSFSRIDPYACQKGDERSGQRNNL